MKANNLIDTVLKVAHLKNDAALAKHLSIPPAAISKIRSKKMNVSAETILRIHERVGLPVAEIRGLMAEEPIAEATATADTTTSTAPETPLTDTAGDTDVHAIRETSAGSPESDGGEVVSAYAPLGA